MPEPLHPPSAERRPAWRAAALAYRQARRDGASHDAAMDAAERSLRQHGRSCPPRRPLPRSLPRSLTQAAITRHGFGTALFPSSPLERGCSTTFGHPHSVMATPRVGLPGQRYRSGLDPMLYAGRNKAKGDMRRHETLEGVLRRGRLSRNVAKMVSAPMRRVWMGASGWVPVRRNWQA